MKKIIPLVLITILAILAFTSCSKTPTPLDDRISIVSTIFPSYDFARSIVGDKANVSMLLPPASESHSFEPSPQDILKIKNCNVFIYVGGESDKWMSKILASIDTSKIKIISLIDCVKTVEEVVVEGMQEEKEEHAHEHGKHKKEYDEHVWTSPINAKLIVQNISDTLCEIDKDNAKTYTDNMKDYLKKLDKLDGMFKDIVKNASRKTIIFGDRFPFRYFTDAYGLEYFAAFPGCSTETDANAATVKFLIDKMKAKKIPVVFHIELSNKKMANAIAEETNAKVLLLHACHNISKLDFDAKKSYIDLMTDNVQSLKEALK